MKNRWKSNPFVYTAILLSALFVILVAFAIGLGYYIFAIPEPEGLSLASWPNTFTDNFAVWIGCENERVTVEEIGIHRLDEYGLWVQILDQSGQEIFSHNKPSSYPDRYTMSELLTLSKSEFENGYTVFVSSYESPEGALNYLIGFPYSVGKYTLYYNGAHVGRLSPVARKVILLAVVLVIFCGAAYSFWLSKKLAIMIAGIRKISRHSYSPMKEKGVFGEVYGSLNKMDEEIRRSAKIQEETDRTRKEWISNITHDLKTPLSPIRGYGELLADGETDDDTVRNYGAIILKNADHMEKLIDDLKLTYQLEAGAIPYTPQKTKLIRFLRELVIDILNDPAFSKREIGFESSIQETEAEIDPGLFRRAVQNIVINGLIHNPPDTVVKIRVDRDEENWFIISVRDNGNGMSEAELSGLWTRYYRGTNTKEKPEGSGLGLAIAKQIITLHSGTIEVKSEPGAGTQFGIRLPLSP